MDGLMTPAETARFLRVSKSSLYRWIKELELPVHRVGRRWRFSKEEVLTWTKRSYLTQPRGSLHGAS